MLPFSGNWFSFLVSVAQEEIGDNIYILEIIIRIKNLHTER